MYNGLLYLDTSAYLWLKKLQHRTYLSVFKKLISRTGDGHLYAAIGLLIWFLEPIAYADFVKVGLLAYLIELPSFMLLKTFMKRDRPFVQIPNCTNTIQPSDKFSMPSGHTAAAFLMAGLVSMFYIEFSALAYGWAILIGNGRVATGVHYPSDVLAGAALGSSAVFLSLSIIAA